MNVLMRRMSVIALVTLVAAVTVFTQGGASKPVIVLPDQMTFVAAPNGTTQATAVGDLAKPGLYGAETRFPPGLRIRPHFHPEERVVLVVSGTLYFGLGKTFDESAMRALPAGTVFTEPAREPHYSFAKDGPVVLHVVGMGPSGTTWLEEKD